MERQETRTNQGNSQDGLRTRGAYEPELLEVEVLRAYDGCRLQGYEHEFTLMFVARKLGIPMPTITRVLAERGAEEKN